MVEPRVAGKEAMCKVTVTLRTAPIATAKIPGLMIPARKTLVLARYKPQSVWFCKSCPRIATHCNLPLTTCFLKTGSGHLLSIIPFWSCYKANTAQKLLEIKLGLTAAFLHLEPRVSKVQSRCFQYTQADTRTKDREVNSTNEARHNSVKP